LFRAKPINVFIIKTMFDKKGTKIHNIMSYWDSRLRDQKCYLRL
jgi:hypothetical protein